MPSISCIIICYNNDEFIKNAVMSVITQLMPVNEIIVADDGSTDGSREIVSSLAREYPQIRPIFREKNLGVAANRDLAIRVANGDLITTLDGDDLYFPEKIEKEFLAMQKHSCSVAYSDIQLIDSQQNNLGCLNLSKFSFLSQQERLNWLASRLGPIPRDMLLPKKLFLEVGGMNHYITRYEDWDFKIRLATYSTKWAYSGVEGIAYRRTGSSLSSMSLARHMKHQYEVLWLNQELLKKHIGDRGFWKSIVRVLYRNGRAAIGQVARQVFLDSVKSTKIK
jgi:glycosyltransferase involved in cell wall biosynthesis